MTPSASGGYGGIESAEALAKVDSFVYSIKFCYCQWYLTNLAIYAKVYAVPGEEGGTFIL